MKKFDRDPVFFLVAEHDDEIIGSVPGGVDGLIHHLAAKKCYSNQGNGCRFMPYLERLMVQKGSLQSFVLITKKHPVKEFFAKQDSAELDLLAMGKDLQ